MLNFLDFRATFSYNKDGKLDGPNNCVINNAYHDHEMYKKCTYKNGKLDGEYKETPEYKEGGRTLECFYKEGILDGRYFEETKEHKIECNYKDGNLDGEYKKYVKDFYKNHDKGCNPVCLEEFCDNNFLVI